MKPLRLPVTIGLIPLLSACAALNPPPAEPAPELPAPVIAEPAPARVDEGTILPLLGYYHLVQRMTAAEIARERQALAATAASPSVQVQRAMLLGMPRPAPDLHRALALLDAVQRSQAPEAASLHPLARVLATQYQERLRLEGQNERLARQLKESQAKRDELQDKLDALRDIERSIPIRPGGSRTSS